jgi:hypothetical protein
LHIKKIIRNIAKPFLKFRSYIIDSANDSYITQSYPQGVGSRVIGRNFQQLEGIFFKYIMSTFDKFVLLVQEFRTSEKLNEAEVKVLTKLIQFIVKKIK